MTERFRAISEAPPAWLWPLVAVAGVALTALPRLRWINIYEDQAVISGTAMQVAAGQVPYRDVDVAVAPGSIYLYAAFYKLVGATVVHQRLLTTAAMLISVWLFAYIGQRLIGGWWAAAVALLWGVWLPVFQEFSSYHFWSVAFILAMAAMLLAARSAKRPRLAFGLAGLFAACALVMLQASLPAVVDGVVVAVLIERRLTRSLVPMIGVMVVAGVVVLASLVLLGALPGFIDDTIVYNFQTFGPSQRLPFPWLPNLLHDTSFWEASLGALWAIPMHWLLGVVAPIAVLFSTAVALSQRLGRLSECPDWVLVGILAIGLFASALLVHMSDQNLWLTAPMTLLLVAMRLKQTVTGTSSRKLVAVLTAVPVALIYITGLAPLVLGYALVCHTDGTGFLRQVDTPNGSICVTFDSVPTATAAVRFSSDHPASAIAYLPTAASLYEITGRVPPVPAMLVIPGVTTQAQLARLERVMLSRPVEWVIYYQIDFRKDLPADQSIQAGSPSPFDLFLNKSYQRADQGGLVLFELKRP